jgi:predicted PhzF superfamily epimerase YddE/YHI9
VATYRYVVADVFTDTPLTGNQLAASPTRASEVDIEEVRADAGRNPQT